MAPERPDAAQPDLGALSGLLRGFLRRNYRLLAPEHDDLVQQSLADLVEAARRIGPAPAVSELKALALAILKRRIVDRFRRQARNIVEAVDPEHLPEAAEAPALDARMHYRALLRAVLAIVDDLASDEQALLLEETLPDLPARSPRTPAQRQQLKRLRETLRARLLAQYGIHLDQNLEE